MATSTTQTAQPQQFDTIIDDDTHDAHDGTSKVLAEQRHATLEKNVAIAQQIANNLGPHSETANEEYVAQLASLARKRATRSNVGDATDDVEVSQNNNQQPPPPPPGAAAAASQVTVAVNKGSSKLHLRGKSKTERGPFQN